MKKSTLLTGKRSRQAASRPRVGLDDNIFAPSNIVDMLNSGPSVNSHRKSQSVSSSGSSSSLSSSDNSDDKELTMKQAMKRSAAQSSKKRDVKA